MRRMYQYCGNNACGCVFLKVGKSAPVPEKPSKTSLEEDSSGYPALLSKVIYGGEKSPAYAVRRIHVHFFWAA